MPNQPDVNKVVASVRVPVERMARLRSLARERKMTLTQLINFILHEELDSRPLSLEDLEWIKKRFRKMKTNANESETVRIELDLVAAVKCGPVNV